MAVQLKKQTRPSEYDVAEDDRVYMTRSPSSVRKYRQPLQQDAPGQQRSGHQQRHSIQNASSICYGRKACPQAAPSISYLFGNGSRGYTSGRTKFFWRLVANAPE